jgi:hypothetical protein
MSTLEQRLRAINEGGAESTEAWKAYQTLFALLGEDLELLQQMRSTASARLVAGVMQKLKTLEPEIREACGEAWGGGS